jgi:hypothetical protein
MLEAVRMPPATCPACQATLDAATDSAGGDAVPKPGDLTICIHCTEVLQFDAERVPVQVAPATLAALDVKTRVQLMLGVQTVREFQAARRDQP